VNCIDGTRFSFPRSTLKCVIKHSSHCLSSPAVDIANGKHFGRFQLLASDSDGSCVASKDLSYKGIGATSEHRVVGGR
jgi:hypothetical protein